MIESKGVKKMPGQVHLISWQSEAVEIFDTVKKFERVTLY
jgi:hypothetical protein